MRLIDADKLEELFREVIGHIAKRQDINFNMEHMIRASAMVIEMIKDAPTVTPEPHWIPVTENTLPEENRVVVVCGDKGTWDFGTYRGHCDNIHFWHWKKNTYKRVYWWMYKEDALPEPYKGVTE